MTQTAQTKTTDTDTVDMDALEAELAALEAEEESLIDETDLEADAIAEVEMKEAKDEAHEEQKAETEPVSEADKPKSESKPRKTMTGAAKSDVIRDKLGDNLGDTLLLEVGDASLSEKKLKAHQDEILTMVDKMAKKVGEKAVNLIAFIDGKAKLSTYTQIAFKFMCDNEKGVTAGELIEHLQDQKANGVKGYSKGTANSQGHQMFKLFPDLKVAVMDGKAMKINPDSLIAAKLKDMICDKS